MCDAIVSRGPDDSGYFVDGDFGFGMRRLSIIDIQGGHQPMFTPDGRHAIVFNGELYNHLDIRAELERAGVVFRTHSDTETLLAAFRHWGDAAWLKFEGMFAAAVWDRETRRLTLARDPLGIKPLYLTKQHGGIAFASEIRALRTLPDHDWSIDDRAVHDFFSFGHVQPTRSIFEQASSLAAGHILRVDASGMELERFWKPSFTPDPSLSSDEWVEETRSRVLKTVKRHMLADVTVGSFLSGGVDSSAITAAMSQISAAPVKAFTIGFPSTTIDETAEAAAIARHLGAEHYVLPLEPVATGDLLPLVQSSFDEPCAATAAIPIWHLSRFAAEQVKVVLCGEGSDEVFGGYKRLRTAALAARFKPLFKALGPLSGLVDNLPLNGSPWWNYRVQSIRRFRDSSLLANNFQRFFAATQISTPEVRARLYEPGFRGRFDGPDSFQQLEQEYFDFDGARRLDPMEQFMLAELTVHMPGSLLNRLDRGSMAHSLEARVPFLSHDFVDWSLTMPMKMKRRGGTGKLVLREAIEPWLPAGFLSKRKRGFQIPFAEWFRGDFSRFAREAWNDSGARQSGYLRPEAVEQLFMEHDASLANHGRTLYAIAMFSCWWQQTKTEGKREAA
jgi:asparagine synthase (glutamine-hydrolysing)